jgi:hypothetical protein
VIGQFALPDLGKPWTVDDLERLPEDWMRYEPFPVDLDLTDFL